MWELAARTDKGLPYPWGREFREGCCNSAEAEVRTTADVNTYPKGASGYGCFDMAGNVWEFVVADDQENWSCVLKGGSFRNTQYEVRSYLRLFGVPRDHRPPDFGFRCSQVCEPDLA
jgi:formylglycine-generating enzyme required for sulfatase activity